MRAARLGRLAVAAALVAAPLAGAVSGVAVPGAAATTTLCVELVIDFGDLSSSGAPPRPSAYCAKVPDGSTGADVLAVRARELGKPMPRYNDGLLCAIDGFPETGCGEASGDGTFDYWSYWHKRGDGAWSYSNRGAEAYTMRDNPDTAEVERFGEGWAWVHGQAEGGRPPPSIPYAEVCPTEPAPSKTTSTGSRPGTAPAPAPRPASTGRAPAPAPPASRPGQPAAVATDRAGAAAAPAATGGASPAGTARPTATAATATPTPAGSGAPAATATGEPAYDIESLDGDVVRLEDDDSVPVGAIVGVALVVALAAGATVHARRRRP